MDRTPQFRWRPTLASVDPHAAAMRLILAALCCSLFAACKYDSDERCGPSQVMRNGLCFCPEGTMLKGRSCVTAPGSMAGMGGGSTPGLGEACSTDADCTEDPYRTCVTRNASAGYCSRTGCTNDCDPGYFCATDVSPAYCKRTPTGEGKTCTAEADCAGQDATYCAFNPATSMSGCVVPNCETGGCSPAFASCFDLSTVVPNAPKICVPAS